MNDPANRDHLQQNLQVVVERTIRARRERVFQAWIDPLLMAKWFSPVPMTPVGVEAHGVIGGHYRIGIRDVDGTVHFVGGKYMEILPPERLVFTWAWEDQPPGKDSLVTIEFFELDDSTRVVLRHEQLPVSPGPESHRRGWEGCLVHLDQIISWGNL